MRVSFIAATLLAVATTAVLAIPSGHIHESVARRAAEAEHKEFLARDAEELELRGGAGNSWLALDGKATFYYGSQLDNPGCGGPRPNDGSMIAAVSVDSGIPCNAEIHIHRGKKMVRVKVVDHCDGCGRHHLDLSKGAFKALGASLDLGVLTGLHFRVFPKGS